MTVLTSSVLGGTALAVASTDTAQVDSISFESNGRMTSHEASMPAGTLHAFCRGGFTMTLCGEPIDQLRQWDQRWTGQPVQSCCSRCVAAAPLRHN
jgi:hypothetical protein